MSQEQDLGEAAPADRPLPESNSPTVAIELLAPFLALVPDAAVVVDHRGEIVLVNEQALALFGYSDAELIGRPLEILVPERFRHNHREHRAHYAMAPRTRSMGATLDLWGRRRDAGEFPVDISLAPIDAGEPLVVAAIRDVTERQMATAAMAQLAAIVQSSQDATLSVTLGGQITTWNPGAEGLFGHSAAEAIGRHISFLVPEEASEELEELLAAALAGETTAPRDTRWLRHDGSHVDVALSVSPLRDSVDRTFGFSALLPRRHRTQRVRSRGPASARQGTSRSPAAGHDLGHPPRHALGDAARRCPPTHLPPRRPTCSTPGPPRSRRSPRRASASVASWPAGAGVSGAAMPTEESLIARTVATGQTQVIASLARKPDLAPPGPGPSGPALGLPITSAPGIAWCAPGRS